MATETKPEKAAAVPMAKTPREALEQERILHPVIATAASLPADFDTPFTVAVPHTPTDEEKLAAAAKAELVKKIGEILKSYHNNESEIPTQNEYWTLIAKLRSM